MNKNKFLPLCGLVPVLAAGLYYAMLLKDIAQQTGDPLPLKLYALLLPAVLFGVAAAGLILFRKGRLDSGGVGNWLSRRAGGLFSGSLSRFYFLAGLYLGVLFIMVMPGLSAPDEVSHYLTAYRLSSRMLGKADLESVTGLAAVRAEDYPLEDLSGVKTPEIADDEEPPAEVLGNPVTYYTYRTIADWDQRYPQQGGMTISGLADVRTTPVMYLPQAAGMALVRTAGGSALSLVFAAKFLNLLAFLFLTSAAIGRMPFGKEILCGVGLLPMTLHLAASMSYDSGILGCSFLLCAEILRLAYGRIEGKASGETAEKGTGKADEKSVRRADKKSVREADGNGVRARDFLLICLLTAALSPCKMVYSCLVLLYLLIPAERFRVARRDAGESAAVGSAAVGSAAGKEGSAGRTIEEGRRKQILIKVISFCILLAVSAGSIAAVNASIIRGYAAASQADAAAAGTVSGTTGQVITEGAVVTGEGEVLRSGYTVSELVHRPFFIFRMVCGTFSQQSGEMIGDLMGVRLGNLDPLLGIPFFLAQIFLLGMLLLAMKTETGESAPHAAETGSKSGKAYPGAVERLWIAAVAACVMLLTAGAMLLSWTGRDSQIIEGIQGRYFLPILPLFLLLLKNETVVLKRDISRGILCTFFCMDAYALLRIFTLACMRI